MAALKISQHRAPSHHTTTPQSTSTLTTFNLPSTLLTAPQPQTTLLTQSRLLHLLHHRNKNQHRRSHWYRHFSSFRGEVKKLCGELGLSCLASETPPAQPLRKHNGRATLQGGSTSTSTSTITALRALKASRAAKHEAQRRVALRLTFWRDAGLVYKWHAAFTHLIATPQFSPLGLALLAILARICNITGLTASLEAIGAETEEAERVQEERETDRGVERFIAETATAEQVFDGSTEKGGKKGYVADMRNGGKMTDHGVDHGEGVEAEADAGVAVSRTDAAAVSLSYPAMKTVEQECGAGTPAEASARKKRRKKANVIDELFRDL